MEDKTEDGKTPDKIVAQMKIPNELVGLVIGKKGASIRDLQTRTGTLIQLPKVSKEFENWKMASISGTEEQIEFCSLLLALRITPPTESEKIAELEAQIKRFRHEEAVALLNVPLEHIGRIIGRQGQTIKQLQEITGARMELPRESEEGAAYRVAKMFGTPDQVEYCKYLLLRKITPREEGGLAGPDPEKKDFENEIIVKIPDEHVGRVIGKFGAHIRDLQDISGASVFLPKSCAPGTQYRELRVCGSPEQIAHCQAILQEVMTPPGEYIQPLYSFSPIANLNHIPTTAMHAPLRLSEYSASHMAVNYSQSYQHPGPLPPIERDIYNLPLYYPPVIPILPIPAHTSQPLSHEHALSHIKPLTPKYPSTAASPSRGMRYAGDTQVNYPTSFGTPMGYKVATDGSLTAARQLTFSPKPMATAAAHSIISSKYSLLVPAAQIDVLLESGAIWRIHEKSGAHLSISVPIISPNEEPLREILITGSSENIQAGQQMLQSHLQMLQ